MDLMLKKTSGWDKVAYIATQWWVVEGAAVYKLMVKQLWQQTDHTF